MKVLMVHVVAVLLLVAAGLHAADRTGVSETRMRQVQLELQMERARLLREDPELVDINRRIQVLYRKLDEAMSAKPSIKKIQAELAALEPVRPVPPAK